MSLKLSGIWRDLEEPMGLGGIVSYALSFSKRRRKLLLSMVGQLPREEDQSLALVVGSQLGWATGELKSCSMKVCRLHWPTADFTLASPLPKSSPLPAGPWSPGIRCPTVWVLGFDPRALGECTLHH